MAAAGNNFFEASAVDKGFVGKVRAEKGRWANGNKAIERANQESVDWLTKRAVERLNNQAKRRAKDPRHGRLAALIADPSISNVNQDGFQWLIEDRMKAADERVAAYARAIDEGSDYWLRGTRKIHLAFRGNPEQPTRGISHQAGYAPGEPKGLFGLVRITKPVPAYEYADEPIRVFKQQGKYARFATAQLKGVGISPTRVFIK